MTTPVCTGTSRGAAATTVRTPRTPYEPLAGHTPHASPAPRAPHAPHAPYAAPRTPATGHAPATARTPATARAPYGARAPYVPYPSFTSFVKARGPVLLRAARSLTANPSDAEDLLQTALTKTYVAWERIEDHRALDGYVRRALLNTRTSQWRKRKVDEFACDELPEQETTPGPDPAEQQSLHDAMWRAVLKLPDRQRAMVVLRYYEDLSEAQTAEVLGVSIGTVKSAVSRALGKLRQDPELTPVR
ncbi:MULTISPECIES: SigE family RNA polymerase sigma factor [unclassified Streptomyces]|uniref:SigE family RNA polymerase sigma factor n=1 Tax=unclassified Streptomyces TaxID=2593676 RepID=UPI0020332F8D|nr:SigE family RNA polymerase sigma factor [Streptomyces sp. RKAG290]MCM2412853.1 SigE family RNA polymerase sigma factor [Streptomyces sp. RKAG290]